MKDILFTNHRKCFCHECILLFTSRSFFIVRWSVGLYVPSYRRSNPFIVVVACTRLYHPLCWSVRRSLFWASLGVFCNTAPAKMLQLAFFVTAAAHPYAISVTVYPALFFHLLILLLVNYRVMLISTSRSLTALNRQ